MPPGLHKLGPSQLTGLLADLLSTDALLQLPTIQRSILQMLPLVLGKHSVDLAGANLTRVR